jgi:3-dehydroquinate dehydratase-1
MAGMKPIVIRGRPAADGRVPLLCVPLVGASRDALLAEAAAVRGTAPDIVEWRVDYFGAISDANAVVEMALTLRRELPGVPLLFTRRSLREGGQRVQIGEQAVVDVYAAVCEADCVDLVDYEMSNEPAGIGAVREASRRRGIGLVCSYHNFEETPPAEALAAHFRRAQELGGDVAKVAVMPTRREDVLTLLSATLRASQTLDLPLISVSMGELGALSRVVGFAFGSALTFGVGAGASAPGQLPIGELRTSIEIARKALHG